MVVNLTTWPFCQMLIDSTKRRCLSIAFFIASCDRSSKEYERLRQRQRQCRWGVRLPFCLSQAIAVQLDRLPLVCYFNPDCDLSLSLSCSKMMVILELSGFSQTKVAIVAELLTSVP